MESDKCNARVKIFPGDMKTSIAFLGHPAPIGEVCVYAENVSDVAQ